MIKEVPLEGEKLIFISTGYSQGSVIEGREYCQASPSFFLCDINKPGALKEAASLGSTALLIVSQTKRLN